MKWIVLVPLLASLSCHAQDISGPWGPLRHLHSECSINNQLACINELADSHDY